VSDDTIKMLTFSISVKLVTGDWVTLCWGLGMGKGLGLGMGLGSGLGMGLGLGMAGLAVFRIDRRLPERSKAWGCRGWAWVCHVSVSECQSQGSGVAEHSSHSGDLLHVRRIPVPQHGVHFVS
jgi:hypothetical protein